MLNGESRDSVVVMWKAFNRARHDTSWQSYELPTSMSTLALLSRRIESLPVGPAEEV